MRISKKTMSLDLGRQRKLPQIQYTCGGAGLFRPDIRFYGLCQFLQLFGGHCLKEVFMGHLTVREGRLLHFLNGFASGDKVAIYARIFTSKFQHGMLLILNSIGSFLIHYQMVIGYC